MVKHEFLSRTAARFGEVFQGRRERNFPMLDLPLSTGTVGEFDSIREHVEEIRRRNVERKDFSAEVKAPFVIGEVPLHDRAIYSDFILMLPNKTRAYHLDNDNDLDRLHGLLPGTMDLIQSDLANIDRSAHLILGEVNLLDLSKATPRPSWDQPTAWHTDGEVFYLIADKAPTQFAEGNVSFNRKGNIFIPYVGKDAQIYAAKPYQIVRLDPQTVHRRSTDKTALPDWRIWIDITSSITASF